MQFLSKEDFVEKFLYDQEERKKNPVRIKKVTAKKNKSVLPFKEETYLDIINIFREKFGEDLEVIRDKDLTIKYKGDIFNIKIVAKRERVNI